MLKCGNSDRIINFSLINLLAFISHVELVDLLSDHILGAGASLIVTQEAHMGNNASLPDILKNKESIVGLTRRNLD